MSKIIHDIHHGLTLEQAKKAAQLALDSYMQRYASRGLTAVWANDTRAEIDLSIRGAHVRAVVDVLAEVLHIDAEVPLLLRAFKSSAVAAVERETERWIAQVRGGAS